MRTTNISPPEINLLTQAVLEEKASFVIGSRNFPEMPLRSKFSNMIISWVFSWLYKNTPKDTQSGFRAFNHEFAQKIAAKVPGGRYETEFLMILLALDEKMPIKEVPISTIYAPKQVSYFRKIHDSIRILKALFQHWRNS